MKIMLVFPTIEDAPKGSPKPPLGIMYIASYLEKFGHEVKIVDMYLTAMKQEELLKEIEEFKPSLLGFSVLTPYMPATGRLSEKIKKKFPKIKIFAGHVHPSALPKQTLEENKAIDYVVIGEGEITTKELAKELSNKKPNLRKVRGIAFRELRKIIITSPRERIEDLDKMPFPAWHLVDMESYLTGLGSKRTFSIVTTRGCPFQCTYCDQEAIWKRIIKTRRPEKVIEEIKKLKKEFGLEYFIIQDDTFTINKQRVVDFCKLLKKEKINIEWEAKGRVNLVDKKTLKAMAETGCTLIIYGVESGSQKILDSVKKGITIKEARDAIRWTQETGMKAGAFWMMGFPEEREEDIEETFQLMKELKADFNSSFSVLVPFPGSRIFREMKQHGLVVDENWDSYWKHFETDEETLPTIKTKHISQKRLGELKKHYDEELHKIRRKEFFKMHLKRIPEIFKNFLKNPALFSKRALHYLKDNI